MPFDNFNFVPESPSVEAPVTDEVLRVLIAGRHTIRNPRNWAHNCGSEANGTYCVLTAMPYGHPIFDAEQILKRVLPSGWTSIAAFNDCPRTTHADVLSLFDRAIAARKAEING